MWGKTELNYAMSYCFVQIPFMLLSGAKVEHLASGGARTVGSVAMATGEWPASLPVHGLLRPRLPLPAAAAWHTMPACRRYTILWRFELLTLV